MLIFVYGMLRAYILIAIFKFLHMSYWKTDKFLVYQAAMWHTPVMQRNCNPQIQNLEVTVTNMC